MGMGTPCRYRGVERKQCRQGGRVWLCRALPADTVKMAKCVTMSATSMNSVDLRYRPRNTAARSPWSAGNRPSDRGLHSFTLELKLSTFGTHSRQVGLREAQRQLKLSRR